MKFLVGKSFLIVSFLEKHEKCQNLEFSFKMLVTLWEVDKDADGFPATWKQGWENIKSLFKDKSDTLFPFPRKCIQSCIRLLQTFYITLHDLYTNISKYLKDVC